MCVQDILAFYITNKLQNVEGFSFRSAYILNDIFQSINLFSSICPDKNTGTRMITLKQKWARH